jgi:hypothetical protein
MLDLLHGTSEPMTATTKATVQPRMRTKEVFQAGEEVLDRIFKDTIKGAVEEPQAASCATGLAERGQPARQNAVQPERMGETDSLKGARVEGKGGSGLGIAGSTLHADATVVKTKQVKKIPVSITSVLWAVW